jgi:3-oxoacyl-[acyl-carrier protein] reductase
MSNDLLLDLAKNPTTSRLIKNLGLPLPMPVPLKRDNGPMKERPLDDMSVLVGSNSNGKLSAQIARALTAAGADPLVDSTVDIEDFKGPGEAFGRIPEAVTASDAEDNKVHGMVFDATGIETVEELDAIYEFFHPWLRSMAKNGRVVILGRPAQDIEDPQKSAAQAALEGFTRSLSKEVSYLGATCNAVFVEEGAEERIAGPLRFLLSARSAYLTGQPMRVWDKIETTEETTWTRSLENKTALVTGAARGIGKEIARLLSQEGANVVILDIPPAEELASKVAQEIGADVLLEDITDADAPQTIADFLEDNYGGVDIVVHNAGVTRDKTLKNMSEDYWDQAVDINLGAVIRINQHLIDEGTLNDNGRIVCLSSVSGIAGNRGQTNYSAAKSGLISYVDRLGHEVAKRGITVNAIAPGFIETRLTAAMPAANREVARRMNALAQGGQPVDVAQGVLFLTTPGAVGVSGNTIRVCGGMLIGA